MAGSRTPTRGPVLVAVLFAGAAVALTLGILGARYGEPRALETFGFTTVQSLKAWVATGVLAAVVLQLATALWMYGRLPFLPTAPRWLARLHRASGLAAVVVSLPVSAYCLYGFGFETATPRTLAHSVAGCAFYGAFVAKMLALRSRALPGASLPLLGGLTFTVFVVAWWSSALWWFGIAGVGR